MSDRNSAENPHTEQIFADPTGRRAKVVVRTAFLFLIVILTWAAEFLIRVYHLAPPVPRVVAETHREIIDQSGAGVPFADVVMKEGAGTDCGQGLTETFRARSGVVGFIPFGDQTALSGLRAKCSQLDAVLYEAFSFDGIEGAIRPLGDRAWEFPLSDFVTGWKSRNRPASFPVISPAAGIPTDALADFLNPADSQSEFHSALSQLILEHVDGGLCVDLSEHESLQAEVVVKLLDSLNARLEPNDLKSCLIGRANSVFWQSEAVTKNVGLAVVLAFRAPTAPSEPMAPENWISTNLSSVSDLMTTGDSALAIATYGEVWKSGERLPERVSFAQAMLRAHSFDAQIIFTPVQNSTAIRYLDDDRLINQIWLSDSIAFNNIHAGHGRDVPTVLWPLGYEDPAIWNMLNRSNPLSVQKAVMEEQITFANHVVVQGTGPFSRIKTAAVPGARTVSISQETNAVTTLQFERIPSPHQIEFFGGQGSDARIAIAFRGLGDARAIDELLEMLAARNLKVTFFLSTSDLLEHGQIVGRLISSGHMIGTQIRPKPSVSFLPTFFNQVRNNLNQHILAHQYGYRAVLVDNPARPGPIPTDKAVLEQIQWLQSEGYLPVHSALAAPFGRFNPDIFLEQVRETAFASPVNVMSFDFSVQNDTSTLSVLPEILDILSQDGFRFATLPELAGLNEDAALREVQVERTRRDDLTHRAMQVSWISIQNIVLLLALVVALRSPVYLVLALMRRASYPIDDQFCPPVTVIIPAYNEVRVIERAVHSVLNSDYPNKDVVVVDDGSSDETAALVAQKFEADPRVTLWSSTNHGKWFAENLGIGSSHAEFVVVLDADSMIEPGAIRLLMQPFKDPRVGAVAGTVEIGNRVNFLTSCQAIEYLYTQNVLRRAYETFDGIIVVPGAIGAWRTAAVEKAGGVSGQTITEDADLTLAVHRAGYRVAYQPLARSFTEAPSTIRAFLSQRLRWSFGMFQVSWKHKRSILEGLPVGMFTLVDAVWYGLATSLAYPIVDAILLIGLVFWGYALATEGLAPFDGFPIKVSLAFLLLSIVDFVNSLVAFLFARRFEWKLFLLVPFLRFGYRQLLYISSIRSIWRAVVGRLRSWHKLERTGKAVAKN